MSELEILVVGHNSRRDTRINHGSLFLHFRQSATESSQTVTQDFKSEVDPFDKSFSTEGAADCSDVLDISSYDFILYHRNNPDSKRVLSCWHDKYDLSTVVLISSGSNIEQFKGLPDFPTLPGIHDADDILRLRWNRVPADFSGTADELAELLSPRGSAFLPALTILCQGALPARSKSAGGRSDIVDEALNKMGWSDLPKSTRSELQLDPNRSRDPDWWADPFDDVDLQEEVDDEWKAASPRRSSSSFPSGEDDKDAVDALVTHIETGTIPNLDTVAKAYLALARRLG